MDGHVLLAREDIGRHNALDKLIGAMLRDGRDPRNGFVAITSRASFERVQKAAAAGIGMLAAVSAPTALAVRAASELALRWLASCEVTTRWSTLSQNGLDGTMDADNLVQMANRIGEFFEAMPDREEAQDGITGHIKRYWAPHMRQALLAHVNEGATDLMPIVAEAVHARAALLGARGSSSSACEQRDA